VSTLRHILIDVGNVASGEGGVDEVFAPVFGDLTTVLNGRPVDLYIMTHEHMDHVQGLPYAANKLRRPVAARYSWLTASSAPRYYARNKKARRQRDLASDVYRLLTAFATAEPEEMAPFRAVMLNNNPRITSECVAYLRSLSTSRRAAYVLGRSRPAGTHPFKEAKLEI
jgi:phosphoribosyl 1,2-cyclic phosphodiesterase